MKYLVVKVYYRQEKPIFGQNWPEYSHSDIWMVFTNHHTYIRHLRTRTVFTRDSIKIINEDRRCSLFHGFLFLKHLHTVADSWFTYSIIFYYKPTTVTGPVLHSAPRHRQTQRKSDVDMAIHHSATSAILSFRSDLFNGSLDQTNKHRIYMIWEILWIKRCLVLELELSLERFLNDQKLRYIYR